MADFLGRAEVAAAVKDAVNRFGLGKFLLRSEHNMWKN